jgi:hypothetical protein
VYNTTCSFAPQIPPFLLYQYFTSPSVAGGRGALDTVPFKAMRLSAILSHDP